MPVGKCVDNECVQFDESVWTSYIRGSVFAVHVTHHLFRRQGCALLQSVTIDLKAFGWHAKTTLATCNTNGNTCYSGAIGE